VIAEDNAVAFAGSQGNSELATDCGTSVEGTRLNRKRINKMVSRSLMLVTALSPVIGYDNALAVAHKANDGDLSLKGTAVRAGRHRRGAL
jgi:fumarate hydratase class II